MQTVVAKVVAKAVARCYNIQCASRDGAMIGCLGKGQMEVTRVVLARWHCNCNDSKHRSACKHGGNRNVYGDGDGEGQAYA
eukprot:10876053-Alexandrium_andersonii.AAC.1